MRTARTPEPCNSSARTYAANGTRSVSPIWRVASSSRDISLLVTQPSASPIATATTADSANWPTATGQENVPLTAAEIATW